MQVRALKFLVTLTRLSLAVLLVTCLFSALVPTIAIVSAIGADGGMDCCLGRSMGHCNVALKAKRPPISEPMCGLKAATTDDEITVVAAGFADESQTSDAPSFRSSVGSPCVGDCIPCTARSGRQQKRSSVLVVTHQSDGSFLFLTRASREHSVDFKSIAESHSFSPRGPPGC